MKKILAIAIASAFAAPAFAATANVDIYGVLHMSVDSLNDGNSRGTNVSSNGSRIGFKGSEDLGGGLSAIWQVETTLDLQGSNTFSGARDTFAGLKGAFGTARLGYISAPIRQIGRKVDLFSFQLGDSRNFTRSNDNTGFGGNAWDERLRNSVRYDTPSFGGFKGAVHYSSQSNPTNQVANNNDTDAYGLGVDYENGPIFVGAGYQKNNISASTDETLLRLGAGLTLGDIKLTALYQAAKDQAGVSARDRNVWGLGGGYKLGNGMAKVQYYKANDVNNTNNTGASMYAVGYDYNLSKRTMAFAVYAKTKNDSAARFSMSGGARSDNLQPFANGSDPSGFSVGLVHKF